MHPLDPHEFFVYEKERLLVDMRTRELYEQGSLPGAISLPLLKAPSFAAYFKEVVGKAKGNPIHLYDQEGSRVHKLPESDELFYLDGGFKAFQTWKTHCFESHFSLFVIGGYTGSGKTQLLGKLKKEGIQVLDLEYLAKHRGSIFGGLPSTKQKTHLEFQHQLFAEWITLDPNKPLILEEKGPFLGSASIPDVLYERMKRAPLLHLDLPFPQRVEHILSGYTHLSGPSLDNAIAGLKGRMGEKLSKRALHYLHTGDRKKCVELLLSYYDKAYDKRRKQYWENTIHQIPCKTLGDVSSMKIIKDFVENASPAL